MNQQWVLESVRGENYILGIRFQSGRAAPSPSSRKKLIKVQNTTLVIVAKGGRMLVVSKMERRVMGRYHHHHHHHLHLHHSPETIPGVYRTLA